jgi:hypothetical protein
MYFKHRSRRSKDESTAEQSAWGNQKNIDGQVVVRNRDRRDPHECFVNSDNIIIIQYTIFYSTYCIDGRNMCAIRMFNQATSDEE